MELTLKKLVVSTVPVAMLVFAAAAGYKLVQSGLLVDDSRAGAEQLAVGDLAQLQTPVMPQAVVVEANAPKLPTTDNNTPGADSELVWRDINDAISNLNELVGAEMFLELKRAQNGQMEVRLDKRFWDRVQYQTRVDLKTDISALWHLYATEYNHVDSSVVYFIDDTNDKVIDIFSKTN